MTGFQAGEAIESPEQSAVSAAESLPAGPGDSTRARPSAATEPLNPPAPVDASAEPAAHELNLATALSLAGGQNPQIAFAAARYREAYAQYRAARVLWLPSLRGGISYNYHDGALQDSVGRVFRTSRHSLQAGMGVQAIGAGSPIVPGVLAQFHTADAIFQPKATAHAASARLAARRTATNDTLLATALAYLEVLRSAQQLRIAEETLANARQLADITTSFATSGQGPQADADRAQAELAQRRNEVARSEEAVLVASARLAELLRLDPSIPIFPLEPAIVPIDLVSLEIPLAELVATGLTNRPELAQAQNLVCEAVYRYRREKFAPLVPSVWLGVTESSFGGGRGSDAQPMWGRFDFDIATYWELRNLGFGERARRAETRSQYDQARLAQVQVMDRVAREVVEAQVQAQARRGQVAVAQSGIEAALDSYHRNLQRIRQGQGLPIEVLQSVQALDQVQRDYLRSVADYNQAQFQLQRALGWPVQG